MNNEPMSLPLLLKLVFPSDREFLKKAWDLGQDVEKQND